MIALPIAAFLGLCIGAWSAVRSEAKRTAALRDEILQAIERADVTQTKARVHVDGDLDGAELAKRVRAFRLRTGRGLRFDEDAD